MSIKIQEGQLSARTFIAAEDHQQEHPTQNLRLVLQILRIQLSSEDDLFLLHSLEVSEEDFQALKAEQGILVDFGNFPGKVISLLERCTAHQAGQPSR